jgi:hypothetical protein
VARVPAEARLGAPHSKEKAQGHVMVNGGAKNNLTAMIVWS